MTDGERIAPAYCAELAPPKMRGLFVGMNGINICIGYGLASYMGMAFYYAPYGEAQWRGMLPLDIIHRVSCKLTSL
jgi:MFS family permease